MTDQVPWLCCRRPFLRCWCAREGAGWGEINGRTKRERSSSSTWGVLGFASSPVARTLSHEMISTGLSGLTLLTISVENATGCFVSAAGIADVLVALILWTPPSPPYRTGGGGCSCSAFSRGALWLHSCRVLLLHLRCSLRPRIAAVSKTPQTALCKSEVLIMVL